MIVSYRDKRTRDFATGKRVKAFIGIERAVQLRLDRLEAALSLQDLAALRGNRERRAITGDTALRLAHFFGTSAQFWLNLQSLYELRLAERKAGKTIKALPTLKRHKGGAEPLHAPAHA